MSDLENAGSCKDNNKVIKLWQLAEANKFTKNNDCSRSFLYWFSSLGQIQYTLDVLSSLIPNVTSDDTLKLLTSYKNARNHTMAQYALQLLVDNEFELKRQHFDVLISTSANNGDISSIINILNIMNSYYIEPNQQTLYLIFECLENYFEENKYLLSNVNIHSLIEEIQENIIMMRSDMRDDIIIKFMKWYCQFGDVKNAFILYEDISFKKHALKSDIMQKLAIQQISLLFKNKINLSKAISLLQEVLQINDNSLYSLFQSDTNNKTQIIPKSNTSRHLFNMLNDIKSTNWCHVNVLNLLLHIGYLSGDLHNTLYILHEWYLHHNNQININNNNYNRSLLNNTNSSSIMASIEPNHDTIQYISKLFHMVSSSKHSISIQPRTIDWSIKIYHWLLDKYKNNEFILDIISNTTQNLLRLLLIDMDNIDNIENFCYILRCIKTVIPEFEADPKLFNILGQQTVNNETQIKNVMDRTIKVYGYMVKTRDNTSNTKKITSVSDRARLLGSILNHYDTNICKTYKDTIGGSKQSYFQIRRDLQQQIVLQLHRKYSLNDILTLDVLKLTHTKPIIHTNALTDNVNPATLLK